MLQRALLTLAESPRLEKLISTMPVSSDLVARYVAGETTDEAVENSRRLINEGLSVTLDRLGEDTTNRAQAETSTQEYLTVLERLGEAHLTRLTEVSVKLSALGQALGNDGTKIAQDNAALICAAARRVGTSVTFDMEDHTTVDSTLAILREIRKDFPETGAVLQSYLYRTEADCRDLAYAGSRVRLCKGAYSEPETVAYRRSTDVARAYVRCLKILMAGSGYPMVATHDPRLVEIAGALATRHGREAGSFEYQMLFGIRSAEQQRLAGHGDNVRVYVPYGSEWYAYLMRRLAERPANTTLFLRSLVTKS